MNHHNRILILCGDADGNLGDRAILAATCAAIRAIDSAAPITVVSRDPAAMRCELGVDAVPKGVAGLPALCGAARRSRLVLVGGGGLFQDDDSLVKMPYWAARCALARLCGPRVVGYALGVGPLRSGSSRLSAMLAFATMGRVSVRDGLAQRTAGPLCGRAVEVVPDPAFMLEPADDDAAVECLRAHGVPLEGGPLIGVTVRRWFPAKPRWIPNLVAARFRDPAKQDAQSDRLVARWAATLDRVTQRTGGRIVMLPTYTLSHEGDDRLCRRVIDAMTCDRAHLVRVDDAALYKAVARRLAVMAGGRMHSTIFAASVGTPVVGLAYNPKFAGVFELLGSPHRVMPVERFVADDAAEAFAAMIESAMASRDPLGVRSVQLARRTHAWLAEVMR